MKLLISLVALLALGIGGCTLFQSSPYRIGMDPTWYPQNYGTQTSNINAFTRALFIEIGKSERVSFEILPSAPSGLFSFLEHKQVDAIVTNLTPNEINKGRYDFSDPFLRTGPVLVLPLTTPATTIGDMHQKIIGVYKFDQSVLIAASNPTLLIRPYEKMIIALDDLARGNIDGVLIGTLEAHQLIPTHYAGQLWIASPPLNDDALRFATLKGHHTSLQRIFLNGLRKLQRSGVYAQLRNEFAIY